MLLTKSALSKASEKELKQLAELITTELEKRASNSKDRVMKELLAVANRHGFKLDALMAEKAPAKAASKTRTKKEKAPAKATRKVAPKYANPADASLTWTGRGRKPVWVVDALAAGKTLDELAIKAS